MAINITGSNDVNVTAMNLTLSANLVMNVASDMTIAEVMLSNAIKQRRYHIEQWYNHCIGWS
jgi:hypothetical protein